VLPKAHLDFIAKNFIKRFQFFGFGLVLNDENES